MLRIDREDTHDLSAEEYKKVCEKIQYILNTWEMSAIIIEDYNKGLLTSKLISFVLKLAKQHHIPVAVDPKEKNFFGYREVELFKPNLRELLSGMSAKVSRPPFKKELDALAKAFFLKTGVKNLMVTLSEYGVYVNNRKSSWHFPAESIRISDVSGAGDSVISVVTLAMVSGFGARDWAKLANLAGAQVCEQPGVVAVNLEKLEKKWKEI
jgi:rfaE bifunctional protein kinase chain/domain